MKNKVVKVSNYQLIQFFYPDYVPRTELSYADADKSVLFIGKNRPRIKEWLAARTKSFISVVGAPEVNLTDPEQLVHWVYQKREKEPSARIIEQVKTLDLEYVEELCKVYYVSGRWLGPKDEGETTMYNLFQASVGTLKAVLQTYFKLREEYSYEVIESSYLTFLNRALAVDDQAVSGGYKKLLKQANQKFGSKIKPLVIRHATSGGEETDFINLLTDLR